MLDLLKNIPDSANLPPDLHERFIFFNNLQPLEKYYYLPCIAGFSHVPSGGYMIYLNKSRFDQILLIQEGTLDIRLDNKIHTIKAGETICFPRNQPQIYGTDSNLRFLWFHLSLNWLQLPADASAIIKPSTFFSEIIHLAELLYLEERRNPAKATYTVNMLIEYLKEEQEVSPRLNLHQQQMDELFAQIGANLRRHWTLQEMAKRTSMSESNFFITCKKFYNAAPLSILTRMRMDRAVSLLLRGGSNLEEIAELVGFASAFSFSRAFKNYYKCSPRDFKKRHETGFATNDSFSDNS